MQVSRRCFFQRFTTFCGDVINLYTGTLALSLFAEWPRAVGRERRGAQLNSFAEQSSWLGKWLRAEHKSDLSTKCAMLCISQKLGCEHVNPPPEKKKTCVCLVGCLFNIPKRVLSRKHPTNYRAWPCQYRSRQEALN